jgi:hypothetical protein
MAEVETTIDALPLSGASVSLGKNEGGPMTVVLRLYGDAAGTAAEIATCCMTGEQADALANGLLDANADLRLLRWPTT